MEQALFTKASSYAKSVFHFFFPPKDRLFVDNITSAYRGKDGKIKIYRQFFSLRCLLLHYCSTFEKPHIEFWGRSFEQLFGTKLSPRLQRGFALALFLFLFKFGYSKEYGLFVGALAYDNATSLEGTAGGTTVTVSHTTSGSNRALIAFGQIFDTAVSVTGITYAASALSFVAQGVSSDIARCYGYKKTNPASGANNAVVTIDNVASESTVISVISFTGADQTDCVEASNSATGSSSSPSVAVTTINAGAIVVDGCAARRQTANATAGADQTERLDLLATYGGLSGSALVSTEPKATAGSVTMSWSISVSQGWAIVAIAVKAATATDHTKSVTDTATTTTSSLQAATKVLADAVASTTVSLQAATKTILETIASTTVSLQQATKTLLDTIAATTVVESLRLAIVDVTDTVTATTDMIRDLTRSITETIASTTVSLQQAGKVLIDTITSTTVADVMRTVIVAVTDTITATDSLIRGITRTISETVTSTTSSIQTATKALLDTISATTETLFGFVKIFMDSVTSLDTTIKELARTLAETINSSEIVTAIRTAFISVTDTITATTAIASARIKNIVILVTARAYSPTRYIIVTLNSILINLLWRNRTKPTTSWSKRTKPTTNWTKRNIP